MNKQLKLLSSTLFYVVAIIVQYEQEPRTRLTRTSFTNNLLEWEN